MNPGPAAATTAASAQAFGGFRLGALHLVLPMAALREVLPCGTLRPLPSPAASVIGGIVLRGVTVPVVDLRLALGQPATPPHDASCVVVMVEAGCILGLLADGVTSVFHAATEAIHRMQPAAEASADASATVLAGSVQVAGSDAPLLLLSPTALAHLPQVPLVTDPEPERQHLALHGDRTMARAGPVAARPLLLMRSGGKPLAVDAMGVHATLAHPQVQPSPLAMGHCRGVILHDGQQLPLIDLLSLAGLGRSDLSGSFQAFLLRLPAGLVAFAVDMVVDVVRVADGAVLPVPALAVPDPALCAGAVPMAALPAEVVARVDTPAQQFLLLDVQALKAHADVAGLAASNTPAAGAAAPLAGAQRMQQRSAGPARRPMITYALAGETATPIEQVAEILPYAPEAAVFAGPGPLLGMVVNRGRSIPLLCLSRLNGLPSPAVSPAVSVLVVECDGVPVGFAVPQLRSIEQADWPLAAGDTAAAGRAGGRGPLQTAGLARVGSGAQERLLQVLDLTALARTLLAPGRAQAA